MHDDVARVDDDPVAILHPFKSHFIHPSALQTITQPLGQRSHLTGGTTRSNDHIVGYGCMTAQVDGFDVFSLICVERLFDKGLDRVGAASGEPVSMVVQNDGCLLSCLMNMGK